MQANLTDQDLSLTPPAQSKMGELFTQVDDSVRGGARLRGAGRL